MFYAVNSLIPFREQEPLQHKLREADKALRGITRNMAKVRANEANRAARAGLLDRQAIEEQRQPLGFLAVMRHVPWWGWVLILMHLSYRMSKVRPMLFACGVAVISCCAVSAACSQ